MADFPARSHPEDYYFMVPLEQEKNPAYENFG